MDSIRTSGELTPQNAPALGAQVTFDIPRTADIEKLHIALSGVVTVGTANATAQITDGILNLITSVELVANSGKDVIASLPFNMLAHGNYPRRRKGGAPSITQPALTVGANAFAASFPLDLAAFGTIRPKDSSLRATDYEQLQLRFRFAGDFLGCMVPAGTTTFAASSLALAVKYTDCVELKDAQGNYSSPKVRPSRLSSDWQIPGATNSVDFKLNQNQGLRGLVLRVESTATPPVLSDVLVDRVKVTVGKITRLDASTANIKSEMATDYPADGAPGVGYFYLDFAARHGSHDHLADVLDLDTKQTNGADSLLTLKTTGACKVTVLQDGYVALAN